MLNNDTLQDLTIALAAQGFVLEQQDQNWQLTCPGGLRFTQSSPWQTIVDALSYMSLRSGAGWRLFNASLWCADSDPSTYFQGAEDQALFWENSTVHINFDPDRRDICGVLGTHAPMGRQPLTQTLPGVIVAGDGARVVLRVAGEQFQVYERASDVMSRAELLAHDPALATQISLHEMPGEL